MSKTYFLAGTLAALFVILASVDFIGRKKGFYLLFLLTSVGMAVALAVPFFHYRMAGLGIAMAAQPIFFSLYSIFFSETMRRRL